MTCSDLARIASQRPWPGAISKIRPFRKGKMGGYKQPAHCACDVPHGSDHSSPAHRQSYDAPQALLFSASVGIRLSTRGKGVLPNRTRGGARFPRRGNRRAAAVAWKKLAIAGCYQNGSLGSSDMSARRTSRSAAASLGRCEQTRDPERCDGADLERPGRPRLPIQHRPRRRRIR